eukprot:15366819-Ditylum_brightwellii.AAC.1
MRKFETKVMGNKAVKDHLKRAFGLTDREGYCFGCIKRKKKETDGCCRSNVTCTSWNNAHSRNNVERNISNHDASVQSLGRCDNNSDDESISDDGSNYKIDGMAFLQVGRIDRADKESDGKEEINVMDPGWKWNRWQDIAEDEDIPGLEAVGPYNGPHGLKPGIASTFTTVLQCTFTCSAMDEEFFK